MIKQKRDFIVFGGDTLERYVPTFLRTKATTTEQNLNLSDIGVFRKTRHLLTGQEEKTIEK